MTSGTVPRATTLAVGDVDDAVAALGLVHVVGRDQHGQAAGGELVDLVPELAPRLGIDAGGRLVEEQELRLVHDAGGERQPLLPAAGQRAGELVLAVGQAELRQRPVDMFGARRQVVEPGDEVEILPDRQILVEGEALGHVADFELDAVGLGRDVVAEAGAAARRRVSATRRSCGSWWSCPSRWGRGSRRSRHGRRSCRHDRPPSCR